MSSSVSNRIYEFDGTKETMQNNARFIITRSKLISQSESNSSRQHELREELNNYIISQPGQRLAAIENGVNTRYAQIGTIPKGVLIVAIIQEEFHSPNKLVLAKADYSEFVEERTGSRKNGLPTKKKLFKAVSISFLEQEDGTIKFLKSVVYDKSNRDAKYWWHDFLELKEVRTNEHNTMTAYDVIKKKLILPLKIRYKADYLRLFNLNLSIFSRDYTFDIEEYGNILDQYHPVDSELNMQELKQKLLSLPAENDFDSVFRVLPQYIKDKEKRHVISLAPTIDLTLKGSIDDLPDKILSKRDDEADNIYAYTQMRVSSILGVLSNDSVC